MFFQSIYHSFTIQVNRLIYVLSEIVQSGCAYGVWWVLFRGRQSTFYGHRYRAREEYARDPATFANDFTRQDAAILNIQRACEAALGMGQHLIRRDKLGVPQSARDIFTLLAQASWITDELDTALKHMVGFRNIAIHDYQTLQLSITVAIIEQHLDEFLQYSKALIIHDTNVS